MFGATHDIDDYLRRFQAELDAIDRAEVHRLADLIHNAWDQERFIYVFGNGGSGATASHFAEDLGKNALAEADRRDERRKRPRVMSLTDNTSWITAIGNDLDFQQIFVQQLMQYGRPGDLVIAISGSGSSRNVLNAVEWANRAGAGYLRPDRLRRRPTAADPAARTACSDWRHGHGRKRSFDHPALGRRGDPRPRESRRATRPHGLTLESDGTRMLSGSPGTGHSATGGIHS